MCAGEDQYDEIVVVVVLAAGGVAIVLLVVLAMRHPAEDRGQIKVVFVSAAAIPSPSSLLSSSLSSLPSSSSSSLLPSLAPSFVSLPGKTDQSCPQ